jgi:hypothetical protein
MDFIDVSDSVDLSKFVRFVESTGDFPFIEGVLPSGKTGLRVFSPGNLIEVDGVDSERCARPGRLTLIALSDSAFSFAVLSGGGLEGLVLRTLVSADV